MDMKGHESSIIRMARILRWGTLFLAILIVALTGLVAVAGDGALGNTVHVNGPLPKPWSMGVAILVSGLTAWALMELWQMFGHVVAGTGIFTTPVITRFRRFALLQLTASVVGLVVPPALAVALAAIGGRADMQVSVDAHDLLSVLLALLFYFVAKLLNEAAIFEDDSRSII